MTSAILKYKSFMKLTSANFGLKYMGRLDRNSTMKLNKFSGKVYLSTGGTTNQNVKTIEMLKDSSITNHAVYFSKLNSLFDELKRNLVEMEWAKESDLNLDQSKIDKITKFNQNNPKLVSIINNRIKSSSDFNETIEYFNTNLNQLNRSELAILFRVFNIIDNRPSENELILNIEKQFYSLFQSVSLEQQHPIDNKSTREEDQKDIKNNGSIDRESEQNLQVLINFYHGFYKLRFKSNYFVDLMHFYSTSTSHFCRLLNELVNNESVMESDDRVKQIIDGISCFGIAMSQEALNASFLATIEYCKSPQNIACVQNLAISNKISSNKDKVMYEKIILVNDKNHFGEWIFSYKNYMENYFSFLFDKKMDNKQNEAINREMQSILKLFLDANNFFDASNICKFMSYLNSHSKYKDFFKNVLNNYKEKKSVDAKIENMIVKADFLSLFKIFDGNSSDDYNFYKTLGIEVLKLKEVIEILKNSDIHDEKHLQSIFEITNCFPQIFDSNMANGLYDKNSKYFVLYSFINKNYFHENSAIILNALENNINNFNLYEIRFMTHRWLDIFENLDRRIQYEHSTNAIIEKFIDLVLPKASEQLLLKNSEFRDMEIQRNDKMNFKLYKIKYRFSLISNILNNILGMNENYFNIKIDLNLNEFNAITDNYVKMFDYLKTNYDNKSYLNEPEYLQVKFEFERFLDHIRYLSILELVVKCTKKFDPLFALQLLEIFNKVSNILLDPFFKQLALKYKSDDYTNHILMLFNSLRLFNYVDIDDIRNNSNEKDKFDVLLKQTHKNLDCLVEKVKLDSQRVKRINALFLNMNHLNEKFIVNLFRDYKENQLNSNSLIIFMQQLFYCFPHNNILKKDDRRFVERNAEKKTLPFNLFNIIEKNNTFHNILTQNPAYENGIYPDFEIKIGKNGEIVKPSNKSEVFYRIPIFIIHDKYKLIDTDSNTYIQKRFRSYHFLKSKYPTASFFYSDFENKTRDEIDKIFYEKVTKCFKDFNKTKV